MSFSEAFIRRPVATTLLTLALALAGIVAYFFLPVAPLPQVDFPTIQVYAGLPGASPATMASSVAAPLEKHLGVIAGVTEMTSTSYEGSTSIVLQFDLNRDINGAARDVQAAINAAEADLPADMPSRPGYYKVNPADAPLLIMALTSNIYGKGRMYDAASTILAQKVSQVPGIGQVFVGGAALPAVRVEVNPLALNNLGLSLEDVRSALAAANADIPKGVLAAGRDTWTIGSTDQLLTAKAYRPLIIAYRHGAPVRLDQVADVINGVQDVRAGALANGQPAISLIVFRQPGANIIDAVNRVRALLPQLRASIPAGINLVIRVDRSKAIRASVFDVEITLMISVVLVILVVFVFLRDVRSTLIPSVAVPISLIGTFAVMYVCGYSIDNLSLMALTISTGFVVDDAIVVIENITRYLERGYSPFRAAIHGARTITFTVVSISASLLAVFIPILLMGGIVGRLFREFAVTLSAAVAVSLLVSLTTTPMMCAALLGHHRAEKHGRVYKWTEHLFQNALGFYERTLATALRHKVAMIAATIGAVALTIYLFIVIPKGFFPQQDTGQLIGQIIADQDTSYQAMQKLLLKFTRIVRQDPAVKGLVAFTGGGGPPNTARMFVTLKPLGQRPGANQVIARLRKKLSRIAGARLFLQSVQDLRIGGKPSAAQYQYTLQDSNLTELNHWAPLVLQKMRRVPGLVDVNSDQQNRGLQETVKSDHAMAARLGITPQMIDNTLYDAFGQRLVSTTYHQLNQYHVVMEVAPQYAQGPSALRDVYIRSTNNVLVPLSAFAHYVPTYTPLSVDHEGKFPSVTLSFNLKTGMSLGAAIAAVQKSNDDMGLPTGVHGTFSGTAQAFQASLASEPLLILAALATVYIVLGVLYESFIHPITILSTLPSAGVGALLALMLFHIDLSIIALIGIILLIGIVKKNAIMMIDFALEAQRNQGKTPEQAIYQACLLRFRPIMMTTMAALLGGLPLALGTGQGSELRRPLGVAIVGGLIFSQALTLYTTPVIYLYLDHYSEWIKDKFRRARPALPATVAPASGPAH